jgi:hypothetical protein
MDAGRYGEKPLTRPQLLGTVTEMEIEFERNVSRELDKKLAIAKEENNEAEVARLSAARDAFVTDLSTLRSEIVNFFAQKGVQVTPGDESKYLQSYNILKQNRDRIGRTDSVATSRDRITLPFNASSSEIEGLLTSLRKDVSGRGRKFAFAADQTLVVSTRSHSESSHDTLGQGRDIQSAGYIRLDEGSSGSTITLYNRSGDYCPTFESLKSVQAYLELKTSLPVSLQEQPNDSCAVTEGFRSLN